MGDQVSTQQGAAAGGQKSDLVRTSATSSQKAATQSDAAGAGPLPGEAISAGWVTQTLEALWPYVSPAVQLILEEDLIPMLPKQVAKYCRIESFSLGECNPAVRVKRAYNGETPSTGKRELRLDVQMDYAADVDIVLDVGVTKLGVSRVEFSGELSIIAKPLMQEIPLAGGLQIYFMREPHVNLLFKEAAVIAELPRIKSALHGAFVDLIRREIVAPHAAAAVMNPDLPLELCDPVWLRSVEPVGITCVQLQEGSSLCRWTCRRPGAPLTPEHSDLRIAIRSFGAEWHSAVLEYCDGDPEWDLSDRKSMACVLVASEQQIITVDAYDDSRLCGPEDRHLAGRAVVAPELVSVGGSAAAARDDEGWLTLDASATGSLDGAEPPEPPKLKLVTTWSKLGPLLAQYGDIAKAVEKSDKCIGALAVRLGSIEKGKIEEPLVMAVRIDGGPASLSRASEPKAWCPTPRLRLPPREQRVVARLYEKGWDAEEIAKLIERPTEVVRREVDPKLSAEQDEVIHKALKGAQHIMDVIWLPVLRASKGEEEGSQMIYFEARDPSGSVVASGSMDLRAAVGWPPLKCLSMKIAKPSAGSTEETMAVQLVLRFRPCLGPQ